MKNLLFFTFFSIVTLMAHAQEFSDHAIITVQIPDNPAFEKVHQLSISKLSSDGEMFDAFTSLKPSADGTISWKAPFSEPMLYQLEFQGLHPVTLILNKVEQITIQFSIKNKGKAQVAIEGSTGNDQLQWFKNQLNELQVSYFGELKPKMEEAIAKKEEHLIKQYEKEVARLFPLFVEDLHKAVDRLGVTAAAFAALDYIDPNKGMHIIESITEKFQKEAPGTHLTNILANRLAAINGMAIGTKAPTFSLPDTNGSTIALSDFKGQYVLIDFWASWCLACRAENPKWETLHQAYSQKGLVILGIGVKDELDRWKSAIQKDELTYLQLSALGTDIPEQYFVKSLPQNVLLDKEGKILAKNLKANELKNWLEANF